MAASPSKPKPGAAKPAAAKPAAAKPAAAKPAAAKPAAAKPAAAKPAAPAAPAPAKKVTKVGEYEVLVGTSPVAFWPLLPGTTMTQAMPPLICSPNDPKGKNTVFVPVFGLFDIVARMTDEPVEEEIDDPLFARQVGGPAKLKKAPLLKDAKGDVSICFAVDQSKLAKGAAWEGTLRLTAWEKGAKGNVARRLEVKLKVNRMSRTWPSFVFFVVHKNAKKANAWMRLTVVDAADGKTPISGAKVTLKVLRDNLKYDKINRRVELTSESGGYLQYGTDRATLAMPSEWPLILTATKPGYVLRAHMCRLDAKAVKKDNSVPTTPAAIRMTKLQAAKLAGKTILLDAGHGVVYDYLHARRVQEWYVAHRVLEKVAELLTSEHGMSRKDILWTRTAGFGLIEPSQVRVAGAPEAGALRYEADLPHWRIRARLPAVGLHDISSLLQTRHRDPDDRALPVSDADRNQFLADNQATIQQIVTRIDHALPKGQQIRPGSVRWDAGTNRYVFTQERVAAAGQAQVLNNAVPMTTITRQDWFALNKAALEALADRSARWSLAREVSKGPAASGARPSFMEAARATLRASGALGYIRRSILGYLDVQAPHPFLNYGPLGWSPAHRNAYFAQQGASCDLAISVHENAGGGKGGCLLVSRKPGQDKPPADQIRLGKVFIKYLDWFDLGVRQAGVTEEVVGNPAAMLHRKNRIRDRHAYIEAEFMDAILPDDNTKYRWQAMAEPAAIERFARQIVAAVVESLLDRQADLEPIRFNPSAPLGGLW